MSQISARVEAVRPIRSEALRTPLPDALLCRVARALGFLRCGLRGGELFVQGSQLVRTPGGTYFAAGADGVWKIPDGLASSWSLLPDTGPIVGGLVLDEGVLYASTCYFGDFCDDPRFLKSTDEGVTWTDMGGPALDMGGTFAFDPGHGLLYSSGDKLLRVRVK